MNTFTRLFGPRYWHVMLATAALIVGSVPNLHGATEKPKLPSSITTQDGKTYQQVGYVGSDPAGLTIQYAPPAGGIGLVRIEYPNLPESLRQEFGYNPEAASQFREEQRKAVLQWQQRQREASKTTAQHRAEPLPPESAGQPQEAPIAGRFQVTGTISGAAIVDSVTGAAWLIDLHSSLQPLNYTPFVVPKIDFPGVP